jgi:hypothetical protein
MDIFSLKPVVLLQQAALAAPLATDGTLTEGDEVEGGGATPTMAFLHFL